MTTYFRRLVFGNSLTLSHIPLCFHAKPPNFPRLFDPRDIAFVVSLKICIDCVSVVCLNNYFLAQQPVNHVNILFITVGWGDVGHNTCT